MKTKKIVLMVIIFSCVTCVFLSQRAQACWTSLPDQQYKCRFFYCCTGMNCLGECEFNFYCFANPFYCCFATAALSNDETKLDVLRQTRDLRMARTAYGRSLIKLYYKHSLELTSILLSDEELLSFVTPVLNDIVEKAIAYNKHEKVSIDHALIEDVLEVADLINEKASPEFKAAIQRVKKQIKSGYIFRNFGMSVND